MHPFLERYISRIYSVLSNHWLIVDWSFDFADYGEDNARIISRVEIFDGSALYVKESLRLTQGKTTKVDYSYQFRQESEAGFFRYDSESHGRPQPYHHKHAYQQPIREVDHAPNLFEVLKEIESILTSEMT